MRPLLPTIACVALLFTLASAGEPRAFVQGAIAAGEGQTPEPEFTRLAAQLAQQRLGGTEESENLQEKALALLDGIVLRTLNSQSEPNLDALNQRLAALVAQQPPVGEDYRVVRLGGSPARYAVVANFSLGGPSAVRVYAAARGRYALAAQIDRFAQKDFFDEYLELIPVTAPVILFVTVTGRTDDLQTGAYTAWRFDSERIQAVWSSDMLQQSSYESRADGFRLTYCAETDEVNPRLCRRMARDRYVWDGTAWKRVEREAFAVPKR